MSSDEDFSLVNPQPLESSVEGIKSLIQTFKKKHEQLLRDQRELMASRDDRRDLAQEFRVRAEKLTQRLKVDERTYKETLENEKARLNLLRQEEDELKDEVQKVMAALKEEEARHNRLKKQSDLFAAVPERKVYFKGSTGKGTGTQAFKMEARIVYPMEGGTALVTFEEEVVAKKILSMQSHLVRLGDECRITVEARPVHVMMPRLVEMDSDVCSRRILVSNLPKMDADTLLYKLEIHFGKRKNGGGEVDRCEMMPDSWTVVVTFVDDGIAKKLTETEHHEVTLQQKHRVRVTPFLNGNITNLQTEMTVCPRTVLLAGIPDVMDQEPLQDMLEIHFQKSTNGGGEIEAFLYNPLGQQTSALLEGSSQEEEEEKQM